MMKPSRPRVLIADKWSTWSRLFKDLLVEGYYVVSAGTLQEASNEIRNSALPFHVAIIDIQLTVDPSHDLDSGQHTLLDEIRVRGTYTKPVIVRSHGPTWQQVMNILDSYGIRYCIEKYDGDFDHARFREVVKQAADTALEEERKAYRELGYDQLQDLSRKWFSVLPEFDGRLDPALYLALLPCLEISDTVRGQIKRSVDSLEKQHPGLRCLCIPHDIGRESNQRWLEINKASLIIADLTGQDLNVFYELGLCDALGKRLLLLADTEPSIPPHLGVFRSILYTPQARGMPTLAARLKDAIAQCMDASTGQHPLGKLRWSLGEIAVHRSLMFLDKGEDVYVAGSSEDMASDRASCGHFYQEFVKPILQLKSCETKEIQDALESRHGAEDAWREINTAGVILADISTARPEILYLLGLTHAQGKPVILLTSKKETTPISLRGLDCFEYSWPWKDPTIVERKQTEFEAKVSKVLDAYEAVDQLPPPTRVMDRPPVTPGPFVPQPHFVWEIWGWRSSDGAENIPDGAIRDILLGLEDELPDASFARLCRDQICRLACSREDRRIYAAVELWEKLWIQESGLPFLPFIRKLAMQEFSGGMYREYRDHVAHSIWVYLLN